MAHFIIWNSFTGHARFLRPLGPHALASWLSEFGYIVKVIDFSEVISTEDLISITEKHIDSSTVGIGVSNTFLAHGFPNQEPSWVIDARIRVENKHPNLDWIIGGNGRIEKPMAMKWRMFYGYVEDIFLQYLDEKLGLSEKRKTYNIQIFQKYFIDQLGITKDEVLPIQLGRGCQFKCTFCQYPLIGKKKGTYIRQYDLVEAELRSNFERFGTTRYLVIDDTANESEEKIIALADIAQRLPFKLEWTGYNRLDLIGAKPYTAQILKDSGLRSSFFGIETFNAEASRIIAKGWNSKHGKEFLLKLKDEWKDDINWHLNFITGLNNETGEDSYNTHVWCAKNKMYSWYFAPLYITNDTYSWKSEFELNYSQYGFRFDDHIPNLWYSKTWDYNKAIECATGLNKSADATRRVAAWRSAEFASVGYSFDQILNTFVNDYDMAIHTNKVKALVANYVALNLI